MATIYIYGLKDLVINKYFYIGATNNPTQRLKSHLDCKQRKPNNTKDDWIKVLTFDGTKKIKMDILGETTQENARDLESYYIEYFKDLGHPLTNKINSKYPKIEREIETSFQDEPPDDTPVNPKTLKDVNFLMNL